MPDNFHRYATTPAGGFTLGPCPAAEVLAGRTYEAAGVVHDNSSIEAPEVWRAADSPHIISGQWAGVYSTLTIEPCAIVVAEDDTAITVGSASGGSAGDIIAVGDAEHPILITARTPTPGSWGGIQLFSLLGQTHLSYVTVEYGEEYVNGGVIAGAPPFAEDTVMPVIDHSTIRHGARVGIYLGGSAGFGPGSGNNTITANGTFPIAAAMSNALGTILDGNYTGNGDDRVRLWSDYGTAPLPGDYTVHVLSVPYLLDEAAVFGGRLTFQPGVTMQIKDEYNRPTYGEPGCPSGTFRFSAGSALVAEGTSATPIVIESQPGDAVPSWCGFSFDGDPLAGASTMKYVNIRGAGLIGTATGASGACGPDWGTTNHYAAISLGADNILTMENTTIADGGPMTYGVGREYCGVGSPQFTGHGNVFTGVLCSETDQWDCEGVDCSTGMDCCAHDYHCNSD